MIVRYIWKECKFQNGSWNNKPIDSYWIECSSEEANHCIKPFLSEPQIKRLEKELSYQSLNSPGKGIKKIYVLVSNDLSSVQLTSAHYPFGSLWNAYSPFQKIEEIEIENLEQITRMSTGENV